MNVVNNYTPNKTPFQKPFDFSKTTRKKVKQFNKIVRQGTEQGHNPEKILGEVQKQFPDKIIFNGQIPTHVSGFPFDVPWQQREIKRFILAYDYEHPEDPQLALQNIIVGRIYLIAQKILNDENSLSRTGWNEVIKEEPNQWWVDFIQEFTEQRTQDLYTFAQQMQKAALHLWHQLINEDFPDLTKKYPVLTDWANAVGKYFPKTTKALSFTKIMGYLIQASVLEAIINHCITKSLNTNRYPEISQHRKMSDEIINEVARYLNKAYKTLNNLEQDNGIAYLLKKQISSLNGEKIQKIVAIKFSKKLQQQQQIPTATELYLL